MIHERHALESDRFSDSRPLHDGVVGHPHLRQEEMEAGRTRRCRHAVRVGSRLLEAGLPLAQDGAEGLVVGRVEPELAAEVDDLRR